MFLNSCMVLSAKDIFLGLILGAVLISFFPCATIHPVAGTDLRPSFLINMVSEDLERKNFIFRSGLPEDACMASTSASLEPSDRGRVLRVLDGANGVFVD